MSQTLCDIVAEFVDKPPAFVRSVVIHLHRATERRPLVDALIAAVGPIEVWDAADGVALIAGGHPTECGMDPGVVRTAGEVGCMVSHISAYQKALQDGISHLIIFEDDCVAVEGCLSGVAEYLRRAKRFAAEFSLKEMDDLVLLGTCGCYRWRELTAGVKATDHFNGSHAYIIGRQMMIQMVHTYLQFLARGKAGPVDGILPLLVQCGRRHVFCPENDRALFHQNRSIPSYIVSDGTDRRKD